MGVCGRRQKGKKLYTAVAILLDIDCESIAFIKCISSITVNFIPIAVHSIVQIFILFMIAVIP